MPTLALADLSLYYEVRGTGPRLLFCNGSGATIERTRPMFDMLTDHFELAVHDQRGLGQTGVPARQATMADYAADAVALLDHLGWDTARVYGISFGGMVAQELAVTVPERIERLALLCTSPGGDGGSSYPLHTLADLSADERMDVSMRILDTRFTPEWLAANDVDRMIVEGLAARNDTGKSDEVLRGERMQLEARRAHDVWDRLHRISCPTFVACGTTDGIAPMANSEAIASRIPAAELHPYEGGHLFLMQDRRAIPEIIDFLQR
jgi:3-oxoadipate enol-lactonase